MAGQPWHPSRFQRLKTTGTIVSCDDYFEKLWIPSRIGKLRSVRSDRYRWRKHVSPLIGSRLVNEITSDDLRDVAQALDAKAVKKGGRGALFLGVRLLAEALVGVICVTTGDTFWRAFPGGAGADHGATSDAGSTALPITQQAHKRI